MPRVFKKKLAILIPAHNEELAIELTIRSAIASGMLKRDIYVVNDASSDSTSKIARAILGKSNVLTVRRSGKAVAIKKAIKKFDLIENYKWMHVADADCLFDKNYFKYLKKKLDHRKFAAVTGYVQSLKGGAISQFRVFEYVWGFEVVRRIQSWLGIITVIPGPTACLRTDIIPKLNFDTGSLTEDFDITLQIHRQKLGHITFEPKAMTYTQDPLTYGDFVNQVSRWYRGFFQGVVSHRVGIKGKKIDWYVMLLLGQNAYYGVYSFLVLPFLAIWLDKPYLISLALLGEILSDLVITLFAAWRAKRPDIISAFPFFPVLRITGLLLFYRAFFEVVILKKFRKHEVGWGTEGRRYQISSGSVANN